MTWSTLQLWHINNIRKLFLWRTCMASILNLHFWMNEWMNERKGVLHPFQRIVRLYRDRQWSEVSWPATLTPSPRRPSPSFLKQLKSLQTQLRYTWFFVLCVKVMYGPLLTSTGHLIDLYFFHVRSLCLHLNIPINKINIEQEKS